MLLRSFQAVCMQHPKAFQFYLVYITAVTAKRRHIHKITLPVQVRCIGTSSRSAPLPALSCSLNRLQVAQRRK